MVQQSRKKERQLTEGSSLPEDFPSKRELIVIAKRDIALRTTGEGVASATGADVNSLADLLASEGVTLQPLFGLSEERMLDRTASLAAETGEEVPDLSVFHRIEASDDRLDALAESLRQLDGVEAAYVKPAGEPPMATEDESEVLNDMQPKAEEPPVATPDFTPHQIYLNAAPAGIDARYAWTIPGGRGSDVKIIDCEWGWRFTHEDLLQNQMGVVVGSSSSDDNHGTAVLGEISGDRTSFGITGICPDAIVGAARFGNSAETIRQAADKLGPGDIILLEIHRAGPRHNFQARGDQLGYIAIEWWPDDFAAIRYAISKGIIVVEAAGNGAENLDDALYNKRPDHFPSSWRNPFNPANPSSGAVVVGAGSPPPGTHGNNHGPDRSRLGFSNYGARIDCQGWGREVTTTGYGDLQGGSIIHKNEWYTNRFSGTSSASPIVVGALGCVQGILRAQGGTLLTPARAISLLRSTGSPQQDAPGRPRTQRIGNRPDLRQLISETITQVFTHEVDTYRVLMISGYGGGGGNQIGFIYFYESSGKYIGYAGIIKDGAPLPDNVRWPNGVLNIYFHEAELVALLDTLRNERPLFVRYHTTSKWGSVGTGREAVGEQEEPAEL